MGLNTGRIREVSINEVKDIVDNYNQFKFDGEEEIPEERIMKEEVDDYIDEYNTTSYTFSVSFIEFAIINDFLYTCYKNKKKSIDVVINQYGVTDSLGRIHYGGSYSINHPYWFEGTLKSNPGGTYIFQTKMYIDSRNELRTELHLTVKKPASESSLRDIFLELRKIAFNQSEYVGKCIKVKVKEGNFIGIEIIEIDNFTTELILNEIQRRYLEHFIERVNRGGNARYLLNGQPGSGKTESIREIIRRLTPQVTFVIPDFSRTEDLTMILESCEIFDKSVIIMDDIDLFLGSRDKGSYTMLLGQFLSFFDGVKKRKISLLASTNDKGLVDKAAERPGRFNMTIDYSYLSPEQIEKVCNIHLPEKYRIKEVYDALTGSIDGKRANVTGAFIANLADNIKEMAEDNPDWSVEDTVLLIKESYKGFYSSQVDRGNNLGFVVK